MCPGNMPMMDHPMLSAHTVLDELVEIIPHKDDTLTASKCVELIWELATQLAIACGRVDVLKVLEKGERFCQRARDGLVEPRADDHLRELASLVNEYAKIAMRVEGSPGAEAFQRQLDAMRFAERCAVALAGARSAEVECRHEPDWEQVQHGDGSFTGSALIDVPCRLCGCSGSFKVVADDVQW